MDILIETVMIDDVAYEFRQANFISARNAAMKVLGLLKGGFNIASSGQTDLDFGALLENIGSPKFLEVEQFILNYLEIRSPNGQLINGKNVESVHQHFNAYRHHYYEVIFKGAVFHFKGFLPNMGGLFKDMNLSLKEETTVTKEPVA